MQSRAFAPLISLGPHHKEDYRIIAALLRPGVVVGVARISPGSYALSSNCTSIWQRSIIIHVNSGMTRKLHYVQRQRNLRFPS